MNDLEKDFMDIIRRHPSASFGTQNDRGDVLSLIARELYVKYKPRAVQNLKPKHWQYLLEHWQMKGLSPGTIKNRLSHLRVVLRLVGHQAIIPKSNDAIGVERRRYCTNKDKSLDLTEAQIQAVPCPYIRFSLRLQAAFGLRREESIKMVVSRAWRGDQLHIEKSWTKGGPARVVPVRTEAQRALLRQILLLVGKASLIPTRMYKQQLFRYERLLPQADICKAHGLRHKYAQDRYFELTGWKAPAAGGPGRRELNGEERARDDQVRYQIARELGHAFNNPKRKDITNVYLGS